MMRYKQAPKQIQCPVCRVGSAHILWDTDSEEAAQHFVLKEKDPERFLDLASHIERLWGRKACEVAQCDHCGFCYSNPYVAGDKRFYELAYERHAGGYPRWKWEFQLTYDALRKAAKPDNTLLEIGAGTGAFVIKIAHDILPKENILCTEFSEYGMRQIQGSGVQCLADDICGLSESEFKERFDFVCMFQVLEHLDQVDRVFQQLQQLMKKGGSLFIATPNPAWIQFNEFNGALLDMPPNHIGRWNRKCFEEIGSRTGFQVADFRIENLKLLSVTKEFIIYRFLRKAQQHDSLENRIRKIHDHRLRAIMQLLGLAMNSITAIPALTRMDSRMGASQWVHLIKTRN